MVSIDRLLRIRKRQGKKEKGMTYLSLKEVAELQIAGFLFYSVIHTVDVPMAGS